MITPCRKYLKQLRIAEDDLCPHCGITDNIFHFFFECDLIQTFWLQICRWLATQVNIHLETITPKEAVLGVDDLSSQGRIINFLLLHFRFFVHRQRLIHDNQMDLSHWLLELRAKLRVRQEILRIEGKDQQFKKWEPILIALG